MRISMQLLQVQQLIQLSILDLISGDETVSYNDLRERASEEGITLNQFNKMLLSAKKEQLIEEYVTRYFGYFYCINDKFIA